MILPRGDGLFYEPKLDGFRTLVFRDGDEVALISRGEKPMTRYFPELAGPPRGCRPGSCSTASSSSPAPGASVPRISQRIHPAEYRVRLLGGATPASYVAFDLFAEGDSTSAGCRSPSAAPRRRLLKRIRQPILLTPFTGDPEGRRAGSRDSRGRGSTAWWSRTADLRTSPQRAMVKVKHQRTADCVVVGFRTHKDGAGVGSLLLGLFDPAGTLHHVGVASGFSVARRRELVAELEPYRKGAATHDPWAGWADAQATGRAPRGTNRWNAGKDMTWEPLRPEAVVEVSYDHLQQDRFRHATSFVGWCPHPRALARAPMRSSTPRSRWS